MINPSQVYSTSLNWHQVSHVLQVFRQKLHRSFKNIKIVSNRMVFDNGRLVAFKGSSPFLPENLLPFLDTSLEQGNLWQSSIYPRISFLFFQSSWNPLFSWIFWSVVSTSFLCFWVMMLFIHKTWLLSSAIFADREDDSRLEQERACSWHGCPSTRPAGRLQWLEWRQPVSQEENERVAPRRSHRRPWDVRRPELWEPHRHWVPVSPIHISYLTRESPD